MSAVPRTLWIMFFTITLYPLLVITALILALIAGTLILGLAILLSLFAPFLALCGGNGMDLCPNYQLSNHLGCCIAFLIVLLLYPIIYLINLAQIIYEIAN